MSLVWKGNGTTKAFTAQTSVVVPVPGGVQQGDLLLVGFAFESVGAGSAPYVSGTPQLGWSRVCMQDPSGSGCGLEVWAANWWTGGTTTFNFTGTLSGVAREANYRCDNGASAVPYGAVTAQHTGNNTACPSMTTTADGDQVFLACAQTLASPGYGSVAPYVQAFDNTRAGFGSAEITIHDTTQALAGASGGATFTDTASPAGSLGSTASFAASCGEVVRHLLPILGAGR